MTNPSDPIHVEIVRPAGTKVSDTNPLPIQLFDASGNPIDAHQDADGDYHLGTSLIQSIITSTNNSTTTNLASTATFTGTADGTFGINGIQVFHAADQDCTIYIDQSIDSTFADATQTITDSFQCLANSSCSRTFISVAPYYRLRVTNNGSSTTTKIATYTGMTPIINPLPRSLSAYDRLKTESSITDDVTDIRAKITPFGRLKTSHAVRVIGTSFTGKTKDTKFWTETVTGTGSVTQAGEVTLATGTTADSTVKYTSVRKARHVAGTANEFKFTGRLSDAPVADNIRRCGVYNGTSGVDGDGFFFQVDGTTFGVGARKGGTDTIVNSGSFNGDYGPSLSMDTFMGNFVIWWWERIAYFFVNGKILHKMSASTASLVNTNTLPITMENINENSNDANISFEVLVASVVRFGRLETNPTYYHISGNAATHILKQGAGVLQKIMFNNTSGTNITIYDGDVATGTVIGIITTTSNCIGEWTYNVPFSNGLTMVTVGNSLDATIIYE